MATADQILNLILIVAALSWCIQAQRCTNNDPCDFACVRSQCRSGEFGSICSTNDHCRGNLGCIAGQCRSSPGLAFPTQLSSLASISTSTAISIQPSNFVHRVRSLTNIFENSQTESAYNYAEVLNDGRGVTFGMIGFTTTNGDGLKVIKKYKQKTGKTAFDQYIQSLENSGRGIKTAGFMQAVRQAGNDPMFLESQEEVWKELYWTPSQNKAAELGLQLPLAKGQLYDTWVQHGEGDEPCCLGALSIIKVTTRKVSISAQGEKTWMAEFLRQRRTALTNAKGDTAKAWKASTPRLDIYEALTLADAWNMDKPLAIGNRKSGSYYVPNNYYGSFYIP